MAYQPMTAKKKDSDPPSKTPDMTTLAQPKDELPGARIRAYRQTAGMSQRKLAEICNPPMDFSAIGRIERNLGYTSSTLNRLAKALNCEVSDFFLPAELVAWKHLPTDMKEELSTLIKRYYQAARKDQP
ncbi:MAG: helix-turn-helix domain-containing protein [Endozoicomonas sp.]|uniref:helix-turn-helix domain-containing protein n=1 Tax=Endozoicomonas sp. TaxID=1892382 RepID=UPI003D9B4701